MKSTITEQFQQQRTYFDSGATRTTLFRLKQLRALKQTVKKHEEALMQALHQDLGKPAFEAYTAELALFYDELSRSISHLRSWVKPKKVSTPLVLEPSKSYIQPEPKGVVLIIGPWNYPFQLAMVPLIGALAAGNCVMLKPSEQTPHTAALIETMIETTFESRYVTVVRGPGAEVGPKLIEPHRFDHIFFTGSTGVGKEILAMAAPHLTPVTLELGGKSPAIVAKDANLEVTARRIVWGKYYNAGQTCIAPDYLLVHQDVKEDLMHHMVKAIHAFYGPYPSRSDSYGRIVNQRHFNKLTSYLTDGRLITGGEIDPAQLYMAPTILDDITPEDSIMQAEIFGPILPVMTFNDLEEVVHIVRRHRHPLALYLFTENRRIEEQIISAIEFGGGCINNCIVHVANPHLPFGGVGSSGMGRYHGEASFQLFSNMKAMMRSSTLLDPSLRYAPYDEEKLKLAKKFL
ncbi:aldehyde dehydrogenase [Anoxynatronum sibiricum]|uniref:Aldehyde dehydrogenase n=1 Tax=Anoxynatronum sibiricum TaxID=210623 RepID=A0ABU9VV92_9CLOT